MTLTRSADTDAAGQQTVTVKGEVAGTYHLKAMRMGGTEAVNGDVNFTFIGDSSDISLGGADSKSTLVVTKGSNNTVEAKKADNIETHSVTLTLFDAKGNVVPNVSGTGFTLHPIVNGAEQTAVVTLAVDSQEDTVTAGKMTLTRSANTDAAGQQTVTIKGEVASTYRLKATRTGASDTLSSDVNFTFIGDSNNISFGGENGKSGLVLTSTGGQLADGTATHKVTLTIRDVNKNPIPNVDGATFELFKVDKDAQDKETETSIVSLAHSTAANASNTSSDITGKMMLARTNNKTSDIDGTQQLTIKGLRAGQYRLKATRGSGKLTSADFYFVGDISNASSSKSTLV
ncbi:MAG: hypothetical protein ACRC1V_07040, partial [Plesiomonas sp.]